MWSWSFHTRNNLQSSPKPAYSLASIFVTVKGHCSQTDNDRYKFCFDLKNVFLLVVAVDPLWKGKFNEKSEVYSIGVTILQLITGKTEFDDDFSEMIEEADEEQIARNRDQRLPATGSDEEIMKKLSAMAAASTQRFSKRIQVVPLLRQAREAASSGASEASALRAEVEEMAAELRRLRLQQAAEAERAAAANMTCELCFDEASTEQSGSLTCPNQHFVCADCSPQMVRSFLERVNTSDTMLEEHRNRGGLVPCVHANPAFQDPCAAHYTDQALARALPDEVFVGYRAAQDDITENRLWEQYNQRFQREAGFKISTR